MKTLITALLSAGLALAGGPDFTQAILTLTGATSIEELDESEIERFETLHEHPLDLNLAGRSRLVSSGLFTPFQVASILDGRSRYGDILSFTELSLTDGFTPETAEALKCFIVLRSTRAPAQSERLRVNHSLTVKSSVRPGEAAPVGGFKYELTAGERAAFYWSSRNTFSDRSFGIGSMSAVYYGRRHLGKVIVGSYNARFAEGLAQWSGFSLSSLSSVSAFRKSSAGLSANGSFTSSLQGVAADFDAGKWTLSAACSFSGDCLANATRTGRRTSFGLTATRQAVSLGWRLAVPNVSIFGEAATRYDASKAVVAGAIWIPVYGSKAGVQARWYDASWGSQYSGVSAGFENAWLNTVLEGGRRNDSSAQQYRGLLVLKPTISLADSLTIIPSLRLNVRHRPADDNPTRIDLRAEGSLKWREWMVSGRYNALWCKGFGWLWYVEGAHTGEHLSVYLRGGLFKIDDWDDRIYVYERDAPGSFNVPAYSGRGWSASAYLAWKPSSGRHSFWLRAESLRYPWNLTPKDPKFEIHLQYRLKL